MQEKFDPFVAEWLSFVNNPNFNLVEKCLKFAQILEYPDLDIEQYIQKINQMGMTLKEMINDVKNPTYLISILNEFLFDNLGFVGEMDDYYNPKNNFLNEVIDKKSGLPITLSILYVEMAKFIGLDLKIIGFPSHVLVKYNEEMILDPFNDGRLLDIDDLQEILDRNFDGQLEFEPEFLDEIKSEQVLVRLARNLKNSYFQSYANEKALKCVNMTLAIEPESPEDIRDKGILEEKLLEHGTALKYLNQYLEINPNAEDVDIILEMIRNIKEKINR
ncbi:MAG: transglutaminase-like domain-containing protein [Nitrosopumilus sp.]|nr:transglutaminase-like domain-containing protein [Nitrosopumilus sp.]MDH3386255.1 transglutaminase-like domain-containing protein [Nitrosopumilus sp.]